MGSQILSKGMDSARIAQWPNSYGNCNSFVWLVTAWHALQERDKIGISVNTCPAEPEEGMQCQAFRWTVSAFPRLAKSLNVWYSTPFLRNPVTKFLIISTQKRAPGGSITKIPSCTVFHTLTMPRFEGFEFKKYSGVLGQRFWASTLASPWCTTKCRSPSNLASTSQNTPYSSDPTGAKGWSHGVGDFASPQMCRPQFS